MQPVPKHGRGVQNPSVFHQICIKLCERQHFAMKSELFNFCFRTLFALFMLPASRTSDFSGQDREAATFLGKQHKLAR